MKLKKLSRCLSVLFILLFIASIAKAGDAPALENEPDHRESRRPIFSRYSLEVGRRHSLCTYLSPLAYHGLDIDLEGAWRKQMKFNSDWEMEFRGNLGFADTRSPAGNSTTLEMEAGFSWGMERMWTLPDNWKIGVGGSLSADAGVLYLRRNSNNPANALARLGLNITTTVRKPLKTGNLQTIIFNETSLPTLGAFFSPEYGETYYEIYLGNRRNLVCAGWWGNNFGIDNLLGAELNFGRRSLVIGWRFDLYTQHAHNLDTQLWRHSGVVGLKF